MPLILRDQRLIDEIAELARELSMSETEVLRAAIAALKAELGNSIGSDEPVLDITRRAARRAAAHGRGAGEGDEKKLIDDVSGDI